MYFSSEVYPIFKLPLSYMRIIKNPILKNYLSALSADVCFIPVLLKAIKKYNFLLHFLASSLECERVNS